MATPAQLARAKAALRAHLARGGKAPPRKLPLRMAPCAHQGERLAGQPCGSPLVACALHGAASRFRECRGAARVCQSCADYSAG